jgi:hypothetical protein
MKIETDLKKIKEAAEKREDENLTSSSLNYFRMLIV